MNDSPVSWVFFFFCIVHIPHEIQIFLIFLSFHDSIKILQLFPAEFKKLMVTHSFEKEC